MYKIWIVKIVVSQKCHVCKLALESLRNDVFSESRVFLLKCFLPNVSIDMTLHMHSS